MGATPQVDVPQVDVAVVGGGIAGLWLLARLQAKGYGAVLVEADGLGGGQTLASQGIIHGGLKYALDLKLNAASDALADMPARWRACLDGRGEVDLGGLQPAAARHLFWTRRTLGSRIAGFFGSKLLRGRVDALQPADWPAVLRDPDHVAAVYALDEMVLDVPQLLQALAAPRQALIRQGRVALRSQDEAGATLDVALSDGSHRTLLARHAVVTGGAGNADMLAGLGLPAATAQLRPLHMLMIDNAPGPLWAHCFDASDKPRVTITTHRRGDGTLVWYVGGLLAETGVAQDEASLIAAARAEFAMLLPGADFSNSRFAGLRVDRAEGATADGRKPDGPVLHHAGRVWLAWPTKLALAPQLADLVLAELPPPSGATAAPPGDWPAPGIAPPPWECASWK
ncbi:NAD(P)/FAD-dependent oxidoreductase [Ferrovibrio xuzhouensis]|uniref:NAD(P)/FAD-dependent oxidoreductase n=1 Tax=Ferrovibrio xuzhouensis TaxID=1576914 RepID=A0ABV7V9Q5_9PROT